MKELGYIDCARFPPLIIVRDNEIKNAIRIYEKCNLVVIISDIPILPSVAIQFSKSLLNWVKKLNPRLVLNITGLPVQNRLQIEKPEDLGLASSNDVTELLRSDKVTLFSDGVLFGTYATVIKESVRLMHHGKREVEFETYRESIKLPNTVDPTKPQASFKNGVLEVRLPKKSHGSEISIE